MEVTVGGSDPDQKDQNRNPMKLWQKIGTGAAIVATLAGGTWLAIYEINKNVVTVQTAPAVRQDVTSLVTASGEVKPLTYTNVLGEGIGKITEIDVKEGDHVKKGDVLLRLESVQPAADVNAQRAGIQAADAGVKSAEANDVSTQADIKSRAADLEHAKLDWDRGQMLFKDGLIPKQDYDSRKATYDARRRSSHPLRPATEQARAQLGQARSGTDAKSSHAGPPERRPEQDHLHRADQRRGDLYRRPRGRKRRAGIQKPPAAT